MNESKDNGRLNGKKVFLWGGILSLILVGLVFLYVPAAPKNTGVPKNFESFESAGKETEGSAAGGLDTASGGSGGGGSSMEPNQAESGTVGSAGDATSSIQTALTPEESYQKFCSQCHGKTGNGDSPMARMMTVKPPNLVEGPFRFERTPEAIAAIVRQGVGTMPGFKDEISQEQALQLASFVLQLAKQP